ncbi:MAG: zinc ribbon domain-containing protein [Pirellulales bacterium]
MAVTGDVLRTLHRIHMQLSDLRRRLERGPKQIAARNRNVQELEASLEKAREDAKQARVAVDSKQLDLKASENKVLDWKARLNACNTNKEYQTLLDQIAAAEMAGSVLSDEILEALETIDELDGVARLAKEQLEKTCLELQRMEKEVAEASVEIRADIGRLEAELAAAEAALPSDCQSDYRRVVRAKGSEALASVDGEFCGGCYQQITANMQNRVVLGQAVFCNSCGRLLYLAESAASGNG